jgi:hypothetical protein
MTASDTLAPTIKVLLACGAIAGPLFVAAFLFEGATRADYDPLRHPVSSLALGDAGWMQVANFVIAGLLTLAFAMGLRGALQPSGRATWGPALIAIWGIGLLGAGIFATDPVSGYPQGTPAVGVRTGHGVLHDQFSLAGFGGLIAACFVFSRRFAAEGARGRAIYSAATGVAFAAGIAVSGVGFEQDPNLVAVAGLVQRLTVTVGWTWQTLLALHLLRPRIARTSLLPA